MYNLCCQAQEKDVPRVRSLRVEFKYTVSRGQGIITCNRDWWEKVWGVWGPVFNSIQPWMVFEPPTLNLTWISSRLFTLLLPNLVILSSRVSLVKKERTFLCRVMTPPQLVSLGLCTFLVVIQTYSREYMRRSTDCLVTNLMKYHN